MSSAPKALVLAAGLGTRLKPWTDEKAKPLIPVAGVEALFFALYRLTKAGINEIFVNTHYKAEQIKSSLHDFQKDFPKISLKLSHEEKILGTGGGILKILEENDFPSGLLTINGDTLASFDLRTLFKNGQSTLAVSYDKKFLENYKPIWIDEEKKWTAHASGKAAHFLGAHFLSTSDCALLKKKKLKIEEIDLFSGIYLPLAKEKKRASAVEFLKDSPDFWFDLNTKEFLQEAKEKLSTTYYSQWEDVLRLRHPNLKPADALNFWPLKS